MTERKRSESKGRQLRGEAMDNLAKALLVRHLQESWPAMIDANATWFRDCEPPPRYSQEIRTVAVVGAGASLPTKAVAADLATELEDEFDRDKTEREIELDRLENVYDLKRESFETRLTAICRTDETERRVREEISRRYRLKHPTLLHYELLAHLLHHRYLDMIVSFNFDELLDQSIEDELGTNEYTRVITEGDFDPNAGVSGPLYVKMHGSATEPESLRFTKERYYLTPNAIVELVEEKFNIEHLVLMNLGFTMSSFDFQQLLRKPRHLEIYHFDPKELSTEVLEGITRQRVKARERNETKRDADLDEPDTIAQFPAPEPDGEVGPEFLESLLGELDGKFERLCRTPRSGPAGWRSTRRHSAVVKLLGGSDLGDHDRYVRYLRRRTILEIAFTAAKGRGVVSIASMINDRCGRYYDLYRAQAGSGHAETWTKLCEVGGLIESPEFPDTYEVHPSVRRAGAASNGRTVHQFQLADPTKLARRLGSALDLPRGNRTQLVKSLTETIKYLQGDTEIEIHSCDDRVCSKLFGSPMPLKTLTALRGWTLEMLRNDKDFDQLWLVAETGQWILDEEVAEVLTKRRAQIKLLQAFDADVRVSEAEVETRQLPWGRHNRHMTVICSGNQPRAAIYFVRRLRSVTVTPVYLSTPKDLDRVGAAFENLWEEASVYEHERDLEVALGAKRSLEPAES